MSNENETGLIFHLDEKNTFCISLETHPTRWQKMSQRFKALNINVTRWPASVANTTDVYDNFHPHYNLNPGQKACAQSHINIWKHIQSNPEIKYALILEDDACFDKNWKNKLDQFYNDINCESENKDDWDMILLNASEPINTTNQWVKVTEQYLAAGYIISQKGVNTILNMFHDNYAASDWMMWNLQYLGNSYSYFPWLIIQEGRESTIGSNIDADHEKVVNCLNKIEYSLDNYVILHL